MFVNGIVIQKYIDNPYGYRGIDGSGFSPDTGVNWFFNYDESASERFEPYYDEYIGKTYWILKEHSWVAACTDMEYIYGYAKEAEKRGIRFRVLLCETDIPSPVFEPPKFDTEFLGYDYAYAMGDNYSAVYNEIPSAFPEFSLNEYGLFRTREEIEEYIAARERFKESHPPYTLEEGDFVVFRLHDTNPSLNYGIQPPQKIINANFLQRLHLHNSNGD
ncbi:MAG: hypothetical protein NC078_02740 [Ruminococcus sp.]|nr:hypothetical protein [Ruminococcus sp.]